MKPEILNVIIEKKSFYNFLKYLNVEIIFKLILNIKYKKNKILKIREFRKNIIIKSGLNFYIKYLKIFILYTRNLNGYHICSYLH